MLLAACCIVPPFARAGCGQDVTSETDQRGRHPSLRLELLEEALAPQTEIGSVISRGDRPCSGPSCSPGQRRPHVPAKSVVTVSETWCPTAEASWRWQEPEATRETAELASAHPRHHTSPIERPPRGRP